MPATVAKRKRPFNPIAADPTRTATLRRQFSTDLAKRFAELRRRIVRLVIDEDAFGLAERSGTNPFKLDQSRQPERINELTLPDAISSANVVNARWAFLPIAEKVKAFAAWIASQLGSLFVGRKEEELYRRYAEEGLRKGAGRAFDDTRRSERAIAEGQKRLDFYAGTKDEFLRSAFNQPVAVEKIQLLASRTFTDLKGVTEAMSTAMSRTLTDGLVRGASPREIARSLIVPADSYKGRALAIARTEIVRAHAEGQLMAMEALGVEEVGVAVEWSTAGDTMVCVRCNDLSGVVLTLKEARGMIPRHTNCRCAWIPANVGEGKDGQKRTKGAIEKAIRKDGTDAKAARTEGQDWGPGADIARRRPEGIL